MRKSEGQKTPEKEIANFKFTKPFEREEIPFSKGFFYLYRLFANYKIKPKPLI
jgi:hypothetical protein